MTANHSFCQRCQVVIDKGIVLLCVALLLPFRVWAVLLTATNCSTLQTRRHRLPPAPLIFAAAAPSCCRCCLIPRVRLVVTLLVYAAAVAVPRVVFTSRCFNPKKSMHRYDTSCTHPDYCSYPTETQTVAAVTQKPSIIATQSRYE